MGNSKNITLTKAALASKVKDKVGLSANVVDDIVDGFFDSIFEFLTAGHDVKLSSSFGTFKLRRKKARVGRVPKTGEEKEISARTVVGFRSSVELKRRIACRKLKP